MREFLLGWGDDLFLHGHHLSGWIVDYVDLEESLAVGSLAQEELGHARELLEFAGVAGPDVDDRLFDRPAVEWAPSLLACTPRSDFPATVAASLLIAVATDVVVTALGRCEGAARLAGVLAAEQRLHVLHWCGWARALTRDEGTRDGFVVALHESARASADLFDAADPDAVALHAGWAERVAELLASSGCPPVALPAPRPRRIGEHADLVGPVLRDLTAVRSRFAREPQP